MSRIGRASAVECALPVAGRRGPLTVLVTGFGPFPGAPFNPTGALVDRLVRTRRPAFADVRLVGHVFPTTYAAVDRDFPALLDRHRPDAVLMFGLAARRTRLTIETRARNAVSILLPDAGQLRSSTPLLLTGGPTGLPFGSHCGRLLSAARRQRVPAALSRDAGRYLCNYLSWRALEATRQPSGPQLAAFVHVPLVRRHPVPRRPRTRLTAGDLARAGEAILLAVIAEARQTG
jgi:pyroglutamyl-peptidase